MLFVSYQFIVLFLVTFLMYYIVPKKMQWIVLLTASLLFYSFAGLNCLAYMLATIISTYLASFGIDKIYKAEKDFIKEKKMEYEEKKKYKQKMKRKRWGILLICLFINFGMLIFLKYANFAIYNINALMNTERKLQFLDLVLPMGISFYIFQTMGYIIDVYRGKVEAEKNIFKFALFVSFFPQLIQGPISSFSDVAKDLYAKHEFEIKKVSFGFQRILWGYFKKLVIADQLLPAVTELVKNPEIYTGGFVFVGMIFYAIELYADFTGGIDITIGIAETLGITLKENFNRPYFSKNIEEYWRRWHITMGTWFRDYVFYPLSVCKPMINASKKFRKALGENIGKKVPVYIATMATWVLTGIWHGSSWNFLVWGLLNGIIIIISQECSPLYKKFHNKFDVKDKIGYKIFQIIRTILLMSSLRILDCYDSVGLAFKAFFSMFTKFNFNIFFDGSLLKLGVSVGEYIVIVIGVILMFIVSMIQRRGSVRELISSKNELTRSIVYGTLLFAIIIFGAYGIGYDQVQFIYNQF